MTGSEVNALLKGTYARLRGHLAGSILGLIGVSSVAIVPETEPGLSVGMRRALFVFEMAALAAFVGAYRLRLRSADERLGHISSSRGPVDRLSILPTTARFTSRWQVVHLLRRARLDKLFHTSRALARLLAALRAVRGALLALVTKSAVVLSRSAAGTCLFEDKARPEVFGSIFTSLWRAVAGFTTAGFGDMVPITPGGRRFTALVLFIGLGIIAVPAAIVTTALLDLDTSKSGRHVPCSNPDET